MTEQQQYEIARMALEADNSKIALLMVLIVALAMVVIVFFGGRLLNALLRKIENDSRQIAMATTAIQESTEADKLQTQTLSRVNTVASDNALLLQNFNNQLGQIVLRLEAVSGDVHELGSAGEQRHRDTRIFIDAALRTSAAEMLQTLGQRQAVMHGIVVSFPDTNDPRWQFYTATSSRGEKFHVYLNPLPRFGATPVGSLMEGETVRAIEGDPVYDGWIPIEQIGEGRRWGWAEKNSVVLAPALTPASEEREFNV